MTVRPDPHTVETLAARLSFFEVSALSALPLPREAQPARRIAARPYGSLWRKATKHWNAMLELEDIGLVERTVSRGETLWRLTRPLGLAVRECLLS